MTAEIEDGTPVEKDKVEPLSPNWIPDKEHIVHCIFCALKVK